MIERKLLDAIGRSGAASRKLYEKRIGSFSPRAVISIRVACCRRSRHDDFQGKEPIITPFSATRLYREQHDRLRAHAAKMLAANTADEHRTLLAQLAGSVKMHLKGEDDGLYPHLLAHRDAAVREKAAELQRSMGDLAATFDGFYAQWIKPGAVGADLPGYRARLGPIIDALSKRMDLEDRELYDVADRALTAA